jgi:hypothetical protein
MDKVVVNRISFGGGEGVGGIVRKNSVITATLTRPYTEKIGQEKNKHAFYLLFVLCSVYSAWCNLPLCTKLSTKLSTLSLYSRAQVAKSFPKGSNGG